MEFAYLILLAVLEILFMAVSLRQLYTKTKWRGFRLLLNVLELLSLGLFLLIPGMDWSFRFLCILVLFVGRVVWSGCLYWFCLRRAKKGEERTKGLGAVIASGVLSVLVIALSFVPALVFTGYQGLPLSGPYKVNMVKTILKDESRIESFEQDGSCREIPVYAYYPENAGEDLPLILFSHGAFGYYQSNTSTYMDLASNGYVVLALDHPYHSFFTTDSKGKVIVADQRFIQEIMNANAADASDFVIACRSQSWLDLRIKDILYVLDTFQQQSIDSSWIFEKEKDRETMAAVLTRINPEKVGLMGHSLGGAASVMVGRLRSDISAVADLDGTMLGQKQGDAPYAVPLLSLRSESHQQESERQGTEYINVDVVENAVDGKSIWFAGSGHMNFTDLPLFSPVLARMLGTGSVNPRQCIEQINAVLLAFFNANLKDMGSFQAEPSYFETETNQ